MRECFPWSARSICSLLEWLEVPHVGLKQACHFLHIARRLIKRALER